MFVDEATRVGISQYRQNACWSGSIPGVASLFELVSVLWTLEWETARPRLGCVECVIPHTLLGMSSWSAIAQLAHPGDSIRERRLELGWTQAELAALSGVPQADISRIENGRLDARWSTIRRLSAALADNTVPAKRSLANGRKVAAIPTTSTSKKWAPKGPIIEISRSKR